MIFLGWIWACQTERSRIIVIWFCV